MEYGITIGHEAQRDLAHLADAAHDLEGAIGGHAIFQRADVCVLDHDALCGRIRKRNADLDQVSACLLHLQYKLYGAVRIGIARGKEGDEGLAIFRFECILNFISHGYPPPCI